jgi:hypothetical protein
MKPVSSDKAFCKETTILERLDRRRKRVVFMDKILSRKEAKERVYC